MASQQILEELFIATQRLSAFLNTYEPPEIPHRTVGTVKILRIRNPLMGPPIRAIYRENPTDDHYMSARLPELGVMQLLGAVVFKASFRDCGIVTDEEIVEAILVAARETGTRREVEGETRRDTREEEMRG